MNKLTLLKIIEDTISLYLKKELNTETYDKIINTQNISELTEDTISYRETEFIAILFANIPYYKIISFLIDILTTLNQISTNSKQKCITNLIDAYLSDLLPNIYARLSTEVNAHINELLILFYQKGKLEYDDTLKRITRNIIKPNYLVSIDTAEQINYVQEIIPGINLKKEPLREAVSRTNYNKKSNVERSTLRTLIKIYNEESYQELIKALKVILSQFSTENTKDADTLQDEFLRNFEELHIKAQKKWNEPKNIDENQLTLKLN